MKEFFGASAPGTLRHAAVLHDAAFMVRGAAVPHEGGGPGSRAGSRLLGGSSRHWGPSRVSAEAYHERVSGATVPGMPRHEGVPHDAAFMGRGAAGPYEGVGPLVGETLWVCPGSGTPAGVIGARAQNRQAVDRSPGSVPEAASPGPEAWCPARSPFRFMVAVSGSAVPDFRFRLLGFRTVRKKRRLAGARPCPAAAAPECLGAGGSFSGMPVAVAVPSPRPPVPTQALRRPEPAPDPDAAPRSGALPDRLSGRGPGPDVEIKSANIVKLINYRGPGHPSAPCGCSRRPGALIRPFPGYSGLPVSRQAHRSTPELPDPLRSSGGPGIFPAA
jgi:hypothetical protein